MYQTICTYPIGNKAVPHTRFALIVHLPGKVGMLKLLLLALVYRLSVVLATFITFPPTAWIVL